MATRAKLRRLQKLLRGNLEVIPQRDGSTAYFDPGETVRDVFGYLSNSMRADYAREPRPEPPECLKAVAGAKDRRDALERVLQGCSFLPVDEEALVERGEFVPRSLVAGRKYGDFEGLEDLSG
jgi:hypothetical protein